MSKENQHAGAPDVYPIEVQFPDITPYAQGNCGIPYVFSFDSGVPGPHVMVNALTHGNEVCGAIVVKALLDMKIRPRTGKLTLSFANYQAYQQFDADHPDASRFVEQDLNRVWDPAQLDDLSKDSVELSRARAMRPVVDDVDVLLDIHSMHESSPPLSLCGPLKKGVDFALNQAIPPTIISDEGHPEGRRLRDYAGFGDPESPKNALLIECGQHWAASSVQVAQHSVARFLIVSGVLTPGDLPDGWCVQPSVSPRVIRVTEPVVATSMNFRFAGPYTGLESFELPGTIIAWNDGVPVKTPYPDCVLVMPSLRQLRPGVTVVRFGAWQR